MIVQDRSGADERARRVLRPDLLRDRSSTGDVLSPSERSQADERLTEPPIQRCDIRLRSHEQGGTEPSLLAVAAGHVSALLRLRRGSRGSVFEPIQRRCSVDQPIEAKKSGSSRQRRCTSSPAPYIVPRCSPGGSPRTEPAERRRGKKWV